VLVGPQEASDIAPFFRDVWGPLARDLGTRAYAGLNRDALAPSPVLTLRAAPPASRRDRAFCAPPSWPANRCARNAEDEARAGAAWYAILEGQVPEYRVLRRESGFPQVLACLTPVHGPLTVEPLVKRNYPSWSRATGTSVRMLFRRGLPGRSAGAAGGMPRAGGSGRGSRYRHHHIAAAADPSVRWRDRGRGRAAYNPQILERRRRDLPHRRGGKGRAGANWRPRFAWLWFR